MGKFRDTAELSESEESSVPSDSGRLVSNNSCQFELEDIARRISYETSFIRTSASFHIALMMAPMARGIINEAEVHVLQASPDEVSQHQLE